jgi:hypothetical protein
MRVKAYFARSASCDRAIVNSFVPESSRKNDSIGMVQAANRRRGVQERGQAGAGILQLSFRRLDLTLDECGFDRPGCGERGRDRRQSGRRRPGGFPRSGSVKRESQTDQRLRVLGIETQGAASNFGVSSRTRSLRCTR